MSRKSRGLQTSSNTKRKPLTPRRTPASRHASRAQHTFFFRREGQGFIINRATGPVDPFGFCNKFPPTTGMPHSDARLMLVLGIRVGPPRAVVRFTYFAYGRITIIPFQGPCCVGIFRQGKVLLKGGQLHS